MFGAFLVAIGAGFAHGAALATTSAALEGFAFGLGILAIVLAIAALPPEIAKALAPQTGQTER